MDKIKEWTQKLREQDIVTIGDLRECNIYLIIFKFEIKK